MSKKEKKRALRRHHNARFLARAYKIARYWGGREASESAIARQAHRIRDNRKKCSCWMCCNPRRTGELTLQELRVNEEGVAARSNLAIGAWILAIWTF